MAQERNFKVCARYYFVREDGTEVELPKEYEYVEKIKNSSYCIVKYVERVVHPDCYFQTTYCRTAWGLININGDADIWYDNITKIPADSLRPLYLKLEKDNKFILWDVRKECKMLGGKAFTEVYLDRLCGGIVPVTTRDLRFTDREAWQLADIETGELLTPKYRHITLYHESHFFIADRNKSTDIFDANNRTYVSRLNHGHIFNAGFFLVIYNHSAEIVTDIGVVVNSLNKNSRWIKFSNVVYDDGASVYYKLIMGRDESQPHVTVIKYTQSERHRGRAIIMGVKLFDDNGHRLKNKDFLAFVREAKEGVRHQPRFLNNIV